MNPLPDLEALRPWLTPAAVALAAVLLAVVVQRLGRALLLRLSRHAPLGESVLLRIDRPMQWVLPLLALQAVWQGAPSTLPGLDGVRHLTVLALIAAITWALTRAVHGVADAVLKRHPVDAADNLHARRILTQTRVLSRIVASALLVAGIAFMLMTFPTARQFGASLLASAGVVGLVAGIAARSVFSNLIAGLQLALTQPLRIDDVLIVQGEWGRVEEITGTYVVMKLWDERRLIIPLQWFIENPFQNWTRDSAQIIGSVFLWVDYTTPLEPLREEARRLAEASAHWDGRVCLLQVTDADTRAMQLRLIVSSASSGQNWDLRCELREGLIAFLQRTRPQCLPTLRVALQDGWEGAATRGRAPPPGATSLSAP
ncbi:mechanosensitive ion channel family protein [Aquabacterium sp. J223]|uniref:mechanosensitive ion channel family protein n=1 Tax=Aquabacterium sp. J223 TaxID=2898431 RepID=UPI0021AD671F|nr:mechanosensitive ion channel family protein [Aquabacterium sp. J223]UUX94278.1 mechanosensitive ion channel family protein [Aquabacterium sp. J223]